MFTFGSRFDNRHAGFVGSGTHTHMHMFIHTDLNQMQARVWPKYIYMLKHSRRCKDLYTHLLVKLLASTRLSHQCFLQNSGMIFCSFTKTMDAELNMQKQKY